MSAAAASSGTGGIAKPAVNPWLVAFVVSLATFMEVLDTTITNVSLQHIAGSLAASQDESTWVLTSYLVSNGIVLPLSGWLSGVFGRKRFLMLCIFGFTAASFACGAAHSLSMLIIFRLLQGFAGGGLQPSQQAVILDSFPPDKRGAVFGITGITLIAAPIIGPTLGGWITDNFSWRWIFFINVPVGVIALLLVARFVEDPPHARAKGMQHIDGIGLSLVAIGLAALQIVLDKGQQDDWFESDFITSIAVISAASLVGAVIWLFRQKDPIVDLTLLKDRAFGISFILIFFTGFVLYSSSAILPLLLQTQFGYDATLAGLVLSPSGIIVCILFPIIGKLVNKFPPRNLAALGLILCGGGLWMAQFVTPQSDYMTFVILRITSLWGLPLLFIPISTIAFSRVPKEKSNKASALYSLGRNLGGSVGIALISTYVARHSQTHQAMMVHNLTPGNPVYENMLSNTTRVIEQRGFPAVEAGPMALNHVYNEVLHQSSVLAYLDGFAFLACMMGVGFVLTRFLPKDRALGAAPEGAH